MEYIEREAAKNAFPKAEADAFENCRYCTCLDSGQISDILDAIPAADAVEDLQRKLKDCRNELCLRCGEYKRRHLGACDGCRWLEVGDA